MFGRRVLLVIAHPDDDAMFFGPAITRLDVAHILCLSNGGADGLGTVRAAEMRRAAERYGATVTVVDDPRLLDGAHWDVAVVAQRVGEALGRHDAVLTFDARGVSGHANHVATSAGVRLALSSNKQVALLELETVRGAFLGPFALVALLWRRGPAFVTVRPWDVWAAMAVHASQFVWFRKAFILLSSYTYVNYCHLVPQPW